MEQTYPIYLINIYLRPAHGAMVRLLIRVLIRRVFILWWTRAAKQSRIMTICPRWLLPTTPDSHFALTAPSSTLLITPTQAAQMDGVHGGESAQEGCARPGSPPAPIRAPGGDRTRRFLHRDRLRHCIGRQVERITLKRAAVRRHASVRDHDRWYARPARSSPISRALDNGDSLERR